MMDDDANDDDDGRTVVRGAPKIVKRSKTSLSQPPTTISPAAVIKATLESARANRRDQLMPGPPSDLLEDSADFPESPKTPFIGLTASPKSFDRAPAVFDRTAPPFEGPPSHRPQSYAPPPSSHAGYPQHGAPPAAASYARGVQASHYGQVPSAAPSIPGVAPSVPAHFMTPQAPYSNNDPPATAVTSGHKVSGRPALSWAAALLACGLFVGVGAVAVMQSSDSVADTTASFVDPSRAGKAAQPASAAQPATAVAAAANAPAAPNVPANPSAPADPNAAPPGLLGASPVAAAPPVAPVAEPNVAVAPVVTAPAAAPTAPAGVAFAPVAVPPSTAAKPAAAPPPPVAAPAPAPAPAPKPVAAWKPAPPPPAAAPAPKPAAPKPAPVAAADDEPAPKKTAKAAKPSKGGSDTDDETKKALEALQKAQLESASSFGEK